MRSFKSLDKEWRNFVKASDQRQEQRSSLSRRQFLGIGAGTGAALFAPTAIAGSRGPGNAGSQNQTAGSRGPGGHPGPPGQTLPPSPPTTPFRVRLPIPSVASAVESLSPAPAADQVPGEAQRARHQHWEEFLPQKLYELLIV